MARARFWLERIATGPLRRTESFPIPRLHALVLQHATRDLIAMPQESLALLSSIEVWERFGAPQAKDLNPLHAILDVLTGIDPKPADLTLRWAESAVTSPYVPLHRRAVLLLESLRDPAAGPLLLEALTQDTDDREVGPRAAGALAALGSPWRERMVDVVYRQGTPELWASLGTLLAGAVPAGRTPSDADDALAWWALLTETGGPRSSHPGTARKLVVNWSYARFYLDPAARYDEAPGPGKPPAMTYLGPFPPATSYLLGTIPSSPAASSVFPLDLLALTGRLLAAKVRCALAARGYAAHQESVRRDRRQWDAEARTGDEALWATVHHCSFERDAPAVAADALERVRAFLADVRAGRDVDDASVGPLLDLLPATGEEGVALLVSLLRDVRPTGPHRGFLENAYDALERAEHERAVAEVGLLLASPEEGDAGLARHLMHRSRDPDHVPALEKALARASADLVPEYHRILWWIHSGGAVEPARAEAFARTYAGWVNGATDERAALLVTGLLDLGDAGQRAYADGLRGPRRRIYLGGLLEAARPVTVEVAAALLEPVDARTPPEERRAAWIGAFRAAPAEAADLLAAAMDRVDPAAREEAVDVLEMVRHRAVRSGPAR